MTTEMMILILEWVIVIGAAAAGAGLLLFVGRLALRPVRRSGAAGMTDLDTMRRLAVRLRRLERVARRTERRLEDHVDELRRLLSQAEAKAAPAGTGDSFRPVAPGAPASPPGARSEAILPGILEKQRDLIFRLRLQGLEPMDIARRLRLPIGEVELTLKLHDRQAGTYERDSAAPSARAETGP